jgi:mono/diheme cytochrome c family protein
MKRVINPCYHITAKKLLPVIMVFSLLLLTSMLCSAQQRTPWVTPKIAQEVKNPLAGDKTVLGDAKTLYTTNCAPCHGTKGKGDGPAAAALNPKPADHSSSVIQSETDGSLFWKLSEGRNPMPGYRKILTDKQRWELVNYIRTLAKTSVSK